MPCWNRITLHRNHVSAVLNRAQPQPLGFSPTPRGKPTPEPVIKCRKCHKTLATRQEIIEKVVMSHVSQNTTRYYCLDCERTLRL